MLAATLTKMGFNPLTALSGEEGLEKLRLHHEDVDAVLLDRQMPDMSGMDVIDAMKMDPLLRKIPVVMLTAADQSNDIQEGIDAGVFYYLTKPIEEKLLRSVVSSAVRESSQSRILSHELRKHKRSFELMDNCSCTFKTIDEAEHLSCFLANCFPDPKRVLAGLSVLLVNAVEHGNLGIDFNEKGRLLESNSLRNEILKRQEDDAYKQKVVRVFVVREDRKIVVKIVDEGQGFNWRKFIQADPSHGARSHGHGIAMAHAMSFDELAYNAKGNEVTASTFVDEELEW